MNAALTLLKPKALAFRNSLTKSTAAAQRGQAIAIAGFSGIIMITLFHGTRWGLDQLNNIPLLIYVPPSLPLGLMLMMLLVMTSLTALASALGSFYLADDVETILASPTSSLSFFVARLVYVLCTVAWMPFIFVSPVLAAMAASYQLSAWFIPAAFATFLPFFLIPASFGTLIATIFMATISQRWAKLVIRVAIVAALALTLFVLHGLVEAITSRSSEGQMLRLASSLAIAQSPWLPSAWAASILSEILVPSGKDITPRLALLYSCALGVTGVAHISLHVLHPRGFSRALARRAIASSASPGSVDRSRNRLPQPAALIHKDLRSLTRDIAQSTQIIFLGGLCLFYLGNLKTLVALDTFATDSSVNWQRAFFIIHTAITAFFTSSICTRLVFTSLSLEGKNYWILQTAPVRFREVLRAKFLGWYVPVAILSSLLFSIGTQILIERWELTLLFGLLSFFVSYGIVGMGIGLGAYFADFSWEHPSQLALSVGSLIYMLSSSVLVLLNMVPIGLLLQLLLSRNPDIMRVILISVVALSIALMNLLVAKMALRLGERSPAALE
jgi:ABC-2 type transport system permease protein